MYEERRETFSIKDIILQILLIILFVLLLIWIFPTKKYMKKIFGGNEPKTEETQKIDASANDIDKLAVLYNQIFANNVYSMKEAAIGYYTNERLPKSVGDTERMTLDEMYEKHLLLKLTDKDGNYCDGNKSYVSITKYDEEFQLKVNLSCGEEEDYVIAYLGCYDYCDATGVCEKQVPSSGEGRTTNEDDYSYGNEKESSKSDDDNSNNTNENNNDNNNSDSSSSDKCDVKNRGTQLTLIFESLGGSPVGRISFKVNTDVDIQMPTPERDGYKFDGWYADSNFNTKINITSAGSSDINNLVRYKTFPIYDKDGCGKTDTEIAFLYAKWIEDESKKSDDNTPDKPGDTTPDIPDDNTPDVPDDEIPDTPDKPNTCLYMRAKLGGYTEWGEWSSWSRKKAFNTELQQVETKVVKEVIGTKTEMVKVGTKKVKVVVDTIKQKVKVGTKTVKVKVGTKKVKVKVGEEKQQVGTTTKTVTVKVPIETRKYIGTNSGTTVPSNGNGYIYVKTGSRTSQSCSGCVTKTIYTWDIYQVTTTYKTETRKETVPVYKMVPKYEIRTEDIYETRDEDVYETRTVNVYGTKDEDVYEPRTINVYGNVVYYRYRTRRKKPIAIQYRTSTCDPIDQNLIEDGFELLRRLK